MLPWGVLVEGVTGGIATPGDAAGYNDSTKFEFYADQQLEYDVLFPDPTGIPRVVVVDTRDMTIRYKHIGSDINGLLAAIDQVLAE